MDGCDGPGPADRAARAAVAVAGAVGVTTSGHGAGTPDGTVHPSAVRAAVGFPRVVAAGAADAGHLYVLVSNCVTCPQTLLASGDGGRTWQSRATPSGTVGLSRLTVVAPEVLIGTPTTTPPDGTTWERHPLP